MRTRLRWILLDRIELTLQTELFEESNGVFTRPDSDPYPNAHADSCTKKVKMDVNGMALR